MGFSCFDRQNLKALLLQRFKHIVKFMCVYMLLAVPLKEKGEKKTISLNATFSVKYNNNNNNKTKPKHWLFSSSRFASRYIQISQLLLQETMHRLG